MDQLSLEASRPAYWTTGLRADVAGLRDRLNGLQDRLNQLESWRWRVDARLFKEDMDTMRAENRSAARKAPTEEASGPG